MNPAAVQCVRGFVGFLVDDDHTAVDNVLDESTMPGPEVRAAVAGYEGTLVLPPEAEYERIGREVTSGDDDLSYELVFPLYTAEEGRSDLRLDLRIWSEGNGLYDTDVREVLTGRE